MATFLNSSNFSGRNGTHFHLNLYYDIINTSIENNNHTVRYYLYFQADPGYYGSGSTVTGYINGNVVGTTNSLGTGETKLLGTLDVVVPHDDLGNATASYSASINTPWTLGNASVNGTFPLPNIPRASQPTATSGNIEENIVIYTNRKSNIFTHTLEYEFGSLSDTIATGVTDFKSWPLPSAFYAQIPNASYGTGTITCKTYNGSQLIGTEICQFTAYASEAKCKPEISMTIVDTNTLATSLTGSDQKLIKFVSDPEITITATPKNSATIIEQKISCGDGKNGSGTTVTLNKVESGNFIATTKDSRGFSNSMEENLEMVNYIKLTCNADVSRESSTSNIIKAKITGNYFAGNFGASVNTLNLKFRYKESTSSEWPETYNNIPTTIDNSKNTYSADVTLGTNFDYQKQYDFQFLATDKVVSTVSDCSVKQGIPAFAIFKKFIELWGVKAFEVIEEEEE